MKKLFVVLTFLLLFSSTHTLLNAQEDIILFHSDTCGYCKEVLNAIDENDLTNALNLQMIEASEEGFQELFKQSLEDCGKNPDRGGYPTLYHNGVCSVGSKNVIDTLFELAGIEETQSEEEVQGDSQEEITSEEEEEVQTLDETFTQEQEDIEVEPRPFIHYLLMILGPVMLIALGYFMIKKLNL